MSRHTTVAVGAWSGHAPSPGFTTVPSKCPGEVITTRVTPFWMFQSPSIGSAAEAAAAPTQRTTAASNEPVTKRSAARDMRYQYTIRERRVKSAGGGCLLTVQ